MNNIYSSVAEFWIQTYLKQGAAGGRVRNVMNIAVILCQNGHIAQRSPAQPRQQPSRDGWTALVLPTGNLTSYLAMSALRYRPSFSKKKPLCCLLLPCQLPFFAVLSLILGDFCLSASAEYCLGGVLTVLGTSDCSREYSGRSCCCGEILLITDD